jgi:DNA-binding PucR family transcriptional regulator
MAAGVDLARVRMVVVVPRSRTGAPLPQDADPLSAVLDDAVVVFTESDTGAVAAAIDDSDHYVVIGCEPSRDPARLPERFEDALLLARALDRVAAPGRGVFVDTTRVGRGAVLLADLSAAAADRFVARVLGPLRELDAARGSELLATLRRYMDCDTDARRAATELSVHPNTVRSA